MKHGELEQTEGKDEDHSVACEKRKRFLNSNCSKKSRWQCKVCGVILRRGGDCAHRHESQLRDDTKNAEQEGGWLLILKATSGERGWEAKTVATQGPGILSTRAAGAAS